MEDGLLLVDRFSELAYVDPSACRLLGCSDEDKLRQSWREIRSVLGFPELISRSGYPQTQDSSIDQALALEVRLTPVNSSAFRGYVIRIRGAASSEITVAQLLIASQVRNQNYINEALIHDLRAPLNAMEIHLELLAGTFSDERDAPLAVPEVQRRQTAQGVGILREELARLNRTLRSLLGAGKPFAMEFTHFELCAMLRELITLLLPKARQQRVAIQFRCDRGKVTIHGNRDYLKQAFLNIAINGLEAMPNGGSLAILVTQDDEQVEVQFLDQGPGVAEELIGELCNLRFTTKADGCGLGLYAAQMVVAEAHGGNVDISNHKNGGTCVTCSLPLNSRLKA